jgi:hypothetical protein
MIAFILYTYSISISKKKLRSFDFSVIFHEVYLIQNANLKKIAFLTQKMRLSTNMGIKIKCVYEPCLYIYTLYFFAVCFIFQFLIRKLKLGFLKNLKKVLGEKIENKNLSS